MKISTRLKSIEECTAMTKYGNFERIVIRTADGAFGCWKSKWINQMLNQGINVSEIEENEECKISYIVQNGKWRNIIKIEFPRLAKKAEMTDQEKVDALFAEMEKEENNNENY